MHKISKVSKLVSTNAMQISCIFCVFDVHSTLCVQNNFCHTTLANFFTQLKIMQNFCISKSFSEKPHIFTQNSIGKLMCTNCVFSCTQICTLFVKMCNFVENGTQMYTFLLTSHMDN